MTTIYVDTDEFLMYELHYALGRGKWNGGDGHTWVFESDDVEEIRDQIIYNFGAALDALLRVRFDEAGLDYE